MSTITFACTCTDNRVAMSVLIKFQKLNICEKSQAESASEL